MIHVDLKKLGRIPEGGGIVSRPANNAAEPSQRPRGARVAKPASSLGGVSFTPSLMTTPPVAHADIHADEKAETAFAVLRRAVRWFEAHGEKVERVLSDNGSAYRSFAWRDACAELGITSKKTRAYRPQTNGKIERLHRALADGWAFVRECKSESARQAALPAWLHGYNHHRPNTAIGGKPPINRLTNLPGKYT